MAVLVGFTGGIDELVPGRLAVLRLGRAARNFVGEGKRREDIKA